MFDVHKSKALLYLLLYPSLAKIIVDLLGTSFWNRISFADYLSTFKIYLFISFWFKLDL